jgi:xanthine dehydrogenase molybdopterin-binding subunit B
VFYAGQAIGLVVAETRAQAFAASRNVSVKYKNVRKPVVSIRDAVRDETRLVRLPQRKIAHDESEGKCARLLQRTLCGETFGN